MQTHALPVSWGGTCDSDFRIHLQHPVEWHVRNNWGVQKHKINFIHKSDWREKSLLLRVTILAAGAPVMTHSQELPSSFLSSGKNMWSVNENTCCSQRNMRRKKKKKRRKKAGQPRNCEFYIDLTQQLGGHLHFRKYKDFGFFLFWKKSPKIDMCFFSSPLPPVSQHWPSC